MSIRDRVGDAIFLWQNDRHEGALLSALIAVAATSKIRYGNLGDRAAFEKFLRDSHSVRLSIEYQGSLHPIEHVFYKWLRCNLVHEGKLPEDIEFMGKKTGTALTARAGGAPNYTLRLGHGWLKHLIDAVILAPENTGLL